MTNIKSEIKLNEIKFHDIDELILQNAYVLVSMLPIFSIDLSRQIIILNTSTSNLRTVLTFLKWHTNSQYTTLVDITPLDYPDRDKRFEVIYNLLSYNHCSRIMVRVLVEEFESIPSIVDIYQDAD